MTDTEWEALAASYYEAWEKTQAERDTLRAENERLKRDNELATNELVEYAKLAAAGTAEQQATIERLRAVLKDIASGPCCQTPDCSPEYPRCDVMAARAATLGSDNCQ